MDDLSRLKRFLRVIADEALVRVESRGGCNRPSHVSVGLRQPRRCSTGTPLKRYGLRGPDGWPVWSRVPGVVPYPASHDDPAEG